ncbi:MAG: 4-oxalocrotonate tautomerase [Gammaproteobacteria bacterium]|nr:4-oxalocrotonate tautomerase [Gammaproteobacteria bacterium]
MPLTLTLSEGVLPVGTEKQAFARLCEAMLKWHGLTGNKVMTPNVVGSIHVIPKKFTFSGLKETSVSLIEWKVPSFAFNTTEIQQGYFAEATDIIHEMSGKKLPKSNIWINVVHAVDGAWGIGGQALTNAQLGESIYKN